MTRNKIIFILAIIFLALLTTSNRVNAQADPVGACIYNDFMEFHCTNCPRSICFFMYGGQFFLGQRCCASDSTRTYYPIVRTPGCCSKNNICESGMFDMGYYATCLGYQCNEGNYECIDGTCEEGATTAIELSSFTASAAGSSIMLKWETESEANNAGFNIYRAESENGEYIKINSELIPAKGSSTRGAIYQFVDKEVRNGKTYYYRLEDLDLNGTSTSHGSISATPRLIYAIK